LGERFSYFINAFFNVGVMERYYDDILWGMVVTVQVAIGVVITGILLGLVLASIRAARLRLLNVFIVAFADLFRAFPPLVVILFLYFGLPYLGISLSGFVVVWLVLSLVLAAFTEEIFWAGIISIKAGQWEAASSTGLSFVQTLGYVILPQAVRLTIPPLTNRTIAIVKHTALGAVIGVPEILNEAQSAMSRSGNATPLIMGAVAYLIIFLPVVIFGRQLEKRFAWKRI
jgi:polar amino acid transport system permease protein